MPLFNFSIAQKITACNKYIAYGYFYFIGFMPLSQIKVRTYSPLSLLQLTLKEKSLVVTVERSMGSFIRSIIISFLS